MSDVWCIVSAEGANTGETGARELAESLLMQHREVAVISPDVEPFALLVNTFADAVLTAEIREPDVLALNEAMWLIEEEFGSVDVIALLGGGLAGSTDDPFRLQKATEFFGARWPDADIVVLPAPVAAGR